MLPPLSVRKGLFLSLVGLILGLHAGAQSILPVGSENLLFGGLAGEQSWPSVAVGSGGGFLVWEDNTIEGAGGRGIAGVQLDSDLSVVGQPVLINVQKPGSQEKPIVAALSGGRNLVTWESRAPGKGGVFGRIIGADGVPVGGEIAISPVTVVSNQTQKTTLSGIFRNKPQTRVYKFKEKISLVREHASSQVQVGLPDGGAIVIYQSVRRTYTNSFALVRETKWNGVRTMTNDTLRPVRSTGDWMFDVFLQRLDANGQKVGAEVKVNQYDTLNQRSPTVTILANGHLLVAWVSERTSGRLSDNFSTALYAREFTASGEPVANEFAIGEGSQRTSSNPAVTTVGDGFAIYWSQMEQLGPTRWDVYGRVFGAAGQPSSDAFRVNVYTQQDQYAPRVAAAGESRFVVWTSVGQDGSREGVYGRALVNGVPSGDEIQLNTSTASRQMFPAIAGTSLGRFLAVWMGYNGSTGNDLYTRILSK